MYKAMQQIAKGIIQQRREDETLAMATLAEKCIKCFHYRFRSPTDVIWDHTFDPVGHLCNYDCADASPLRDLVPYNAISKFCYDDKSLDLGYEEFLIDKKTGSIVPVSCDEFGYWFQTKFAERTIKDRTDLGECEFKEFPEPRSKRWGQKDEQWDAKYKEKFIELLKPNLIEQGFKTPEIPEIIAEEFGEV